MTTLNQYQDAIASFVQDWPGRTADAMYVLIDVPAWEPSHKTVFQTALAGLVNTCTLEEREGRFYPAW